MKTTSINIDHHVYFDETYYTLDSFEKLFDKFGVDQVIFSPPCTKFREPEKSQWMYLIQRKMLMNFLGNLVSKIVSKSFYNKNEELRGFWKFFSNKKSLIKIIDPDNQTLIEKIKDKKRFKMWYWINPKINNINETEKKLNEFANKIYGIKFHQYWHSFKIRELQKYVDLAKKYNLPIYLILSYTNKKEVVDFVKSNPDIKFIFGYGGFPLFKNIWKSINENKNCFIDLASNHIDKDIIKRILKEIDVEKILFSTDCPYNFKNKENDFDYNLFMLGLSKIEKKNISQILTNSI